LDLVDRHLPLPLPLKDQHQYAQYWFWSGWIAWLNSDRARSYRVCSSNCLPCSMWFRWLEQEDSVSRQKDTANNDVPLWVFFITAILMLALLQGDEGW